MPGCLPTTAEGARSGSFVLADIVLFQLLVQITAGRTDCLGRLGNIPVVLAELLDEKGPFCAFFESAQGIRPVAAIFRRRVENAALRKAQS